MGKVGVDLSIILMVKMFEMKNAWECIAVELRRNKSNLKSKFL